MDFLNIMDFDFGALVDFLKKVGISIIQAPMKLLAKLPSWTKYIFLVIVIAATVAISIWWWKNREEWRKYKRI